MLDYFDELAAEICRQLNISGFVEMVESERWFGASRYRVRTEAGDWREVPHDLSNQISDWSTAYHRRYPSSNALADAGSGPVFPKV